MNNYNKLIDQWCDAFESFAEQCYKLSPDSFDKVYFAISTAKQELDIEKNKGMHQ